MILRKSACYKIANDLSWWHFCYSSEEWVEPNKKEDIEEERGGSGDFYVTFYFYGEYSEKKSYDRLMKYLAEKRGL